MDETDKSGISHQTNLSIFVGNSLTLWRLLALWSRNFLFVTLSLSPFTDLELLLQILGEFMGVKTVASLLSSTCLMNIFMGKRTPYSHSNSKRDLHSWTWKLWVTALDGFSFDLLEPYFRFFRTCRKLVSSEAKARFFHCLSLNF